MLLSLMANDYSSLAARVVRLPGASFRHFRAEPFTCQSTSLQSLVAFRPFLVCFQASSAGIWWERVRYVTRMIRQDG